ncbi:hypothetical protein TSAR_009374 [Trichomalopsis sarcophagae]|uniref:Uncharacterized protein n=1 Tax=Trichomalopsis sarcophagae TaxID=543379 RepID=A0A232FGR1_9HYME|nr:hypothetical protein TSAR_009374 [Trichomalopsis sarcophagae]
MRAAAWVVRSSGTIKSKIPVRLLLRLHYVSFSFLLRFSLDRGVTSICGSFFSIDSQPAQV